MSTYRLDKLLAPRSIALVGASPRKDSVGRIVLANLLAGGFGGRIAVVNPKYREIAGVGTVGTIDALPEVPDAIVVTAPPHTVPEIIETAGRQGVAGAVIITAGLGHGADSLSARTRAIARRYGLRIIGPNCLGILMPWAGVNASFAKGAAAKGDLALISQSGAIAAGLVEWAAPRSIGFSGVVSLGDAVDVDFGDLIDHFALDRHTRAIMLYIEQVTEAAKFLSATRAAARGKPVIAVKAGRHARAAQAAATHTGALAGSDAVYEAAFRRAGVLRVFDLDGLFAVAETVGRVRPFEGDRLAILTNGGGIGVLAVDRLLDLGGRLAELEPGTVAALDAVLPAGWSRANPVDIIGDADGARYARSLEALLSDRGSDAVLVLNVPTALASSAEAAASVVEVTRGRVNRKPIFAGWIAEDEAASSCFEKAGIPHFTTEADAVEGIMQLVRYRETQGALMRVPPSLPQGFTPDTGAARAVLEEALSAGQPWLDPLQVSRLLAAYDIPQAETVLARDPEEAAEIGARILPEHLAVVAKILSPDIVHKSDVGGVRLDLKSVGEIRTATAEILERARAAKPQARLRGVTLQPMIVRPLARELIIGIADDRTFGPVIVFGRGGTAVEVIDDKAIGLPPLDLVLARDLVSQTRVSRILAAYRDVPAADMDAVMLTLVKVAQMAADLPEIRELDINPLLADASGVIALDARVAVAPFEPAKGPAAMATRLAIRPYPKQWESTHSLADGTGIAVRPVRPEDAPLFRDFMARITAEDLRLRFFGALRTVSDTFIARLTQIDYARSMALLAIDGGSGELLGVVRLHSSSDLMRAEFAVLVRSDRKGRGIGYLLMQRIIAYARAVELAEIEGEILTENTTMLRLCRELGFEIDCEPGHAALCHARLRLAAL